LHEDDINLTARKEKQMTLPYRAPAPPAEPKPIISFRAKHPCLSTVIEQVCIVMLGVVMISVITGFLWGIGRGVRACHLIVSTDTAPNIILGFVGLSIILAAGAICVGIYQMGKILYLNIKVFL
jgi:hypothetical protein